MLPEIFNSGAYMSLLILQPAIVIASVRTAVHVCVVRRKAPAALPAPDPVPDPNMAAPVYYDQNSFQTALQAWDNTRTVYDEGERERIARRRIYLTKMTPLSTLACLAMFVASPSVMRISYDFADAAKFLSLGLLLVGACTVVEINIQRWWSRKSLILRPFDQPAPVFKPRSSSPPPPRGAPPPPRSTDNIRVTSLRQAYDILGLPPGRITLAQARAAYRTLIAQYHPDKVAHLGKDLRDLAAKKALEINLAMEFIEKNAR